MFDASLFYLLKLFDMIKSIRSLFLSLISSIFYTVESVIKLGFLLASSDSINSSRSSTKSFSSKFYKLVLVTKIDEFYSIIVCSFKDVD